MLTPSLKIPFMAYPPPPPTFTKKYWAHPYDFEKFQPLPLPNPYKKGVTLRNCEQIQSLAYLVIFTEEILNGKLHFWYNVFTTEIEYCIVSLVTLNWNPRCHHTYTGMFGMLFPQVDFFLSFRELHWYKDIFLLCQSPHIVIPRHVPVFFYLP